MGGIPPSNIKLLTDGMATKSDLEANLEDWLPRRVTENSTVFVYYAGYGAPDLKGGSYLVPYEGNPDYPSKMFPLKRLCDSLAKLPAKRVVVMLDSRFSGAKGRSVMSQGARPLALSVAESLPAGEKLLIMTGSTGSQISSDYDKAEHGLFTYYLLKGMRGEAAGSDGRVELGGLYRYVKDKVASKASLELNREQTPVLYPGEDAAAAGWKTPVAGN
jgi:uncharacterized caspase-like protein